MITTTDTVVLTIQDYTTMIKECKDTNDNVSKSFFDWYLKTENFFLKEGYFIINESDTVNIPVYFNLNNADLTELVLLGIDDVIARLLFKRKDNLTMTDVTVDVVYFSRHAFKKSSGILVGDHVHDITSDINKLTNKLNKLKGKASKATKRTIPYKTAVRRLEKDCDKYMDKAMVDHYKTVVYILYSLMYTVSRKTPEEIATILQPLSLENGKKVLGTYKYTGYIDLKNSKVYKPVLDKNPDDPIRDYERHINSWTVRGHYRKTSKGLIWIDPHTKGEGELEDRTYSTIDEKELNLKVKTFIVEKSISSKPGLDPRSKSVKIKDILKPVKPEKKIIWWKYPNIIFKGFIVKSKCYADKILQLLKTINK